MAGEEGKPRQRTSDLCSKAPSGVYSLRMGSPLSSTSGAFSTPQNTGVSRCHRAPTTHLDHMALRCRRCWQDQEAVEWGCTLCCLQLAF